MHIHLSFSISGLDMKFFLSKCRKQVASSPNDVVGDVITSGTIFTGAIFTRGWRSVAAGMNAMPLRQDISMTIDAVVAHFKCIARMVRKYEEIE